MLQAITFLANNDWLQNVETKPGMAAAGNGIVVVGSEDFIDREKPVLVDEAASTMDGKIVELDEPAMEVGEEDEAMDSDDSAEIESLLLGSLVSRA